MINPDYFVDRNLKLGFKINLISHNNNQATSTLLILTVYPDFGIEITYINKILKDMTTIYARLLNEYKFLNHILFSASFYKNNEEDQRSDETELFNN